MLKFTSAILGVVAAATIAQPSLAINTASSTANHLSTATPSSDLQAQIIFRVGTPQYRRNEIRRRERERIRRQEARRAARREYNRNYRRY